MEETTMDTAGRHIEVLLRSAADIQELRHIGDFLDTAKRAVDCAKMVKMNEQGKNTKQALHWKDECEQHITQLYGNEE